MGTRWLTVLRVRNIMGVGACCENIQVHSDNAEFSHRKYLGDFSLHTDEHGDAIAVNEAAVFLNSKGKHYVYRNKDGDWLVGTTLGNNKKGVHLRSQDPDREEFIHECPCQTRRWQKNVEGKWQTDDSL